MSRKPLRNLNTDQGLLDAFAALDAQRNPPQSPLPIILPNENNYNSKGNGKQQKQHIVSLKEKLKTDIQGPQGCIELLIQYIQRPLKVEINPIVPNKVIAYVDYIMPDRRFVMRQSGLREHGLGNTQRENNFLDLYRATWLGAQGKTELDAIRRGFEEKQEDISSYLSYRVLV